MERGFGAGAEPSVRRARGAGGRALYGGREPIQLEITHARTAIDVVHELATQSWRETVRERFTRHLGEGFWTEVHAAWRAAHCKRLAQAARNLTRIDPEANCGSVLVRESARSAVKRTVVGAALVDQVVAANARLEAVALAAVLRVAGIVLCEDHGRLTTCQCLKDLAEGAAPTAIWAAITRVCDDYLGQGHEVSRADEVRSLSAAS